MITICCGQFKCEHLSLDAVAVAAANLVGYVADKGCIYLHMSKFFAHNAIVCVVAKVCS